MWWSARRSEAAPEEPRTCDSAACVPDGSRIYAIGDVHGRLDLFETLIALIRNDNDQRSPARVTIILLGDVVDRGDQTAALLALCRAAALHSGDFILLKGNHEEMMVHALRGDPVSMQVWLQRGGGATLTSYGVSSEAIAAGPSAALLEEANACIDARLLDWLDALPLYHRTGGYLFVHAGIRPGIALARQDADNLLWIRDEFLASADDHGMIVVHGHSIVETADIRPNRIAIDTGAYRTGRLTALALEGTERRTICTLPAHLRADAAR